MTKHPYTAGHILAALVACYSVCALSLPVAYAGESDNVDFARQVQPVFARRCYKCHGPTADEGGLQLHVRAAATAELESGGFAIVAGQPGKSALLERIQSHDDGDRMPPEGKPLSEAEISLIEKWISQGAQWAGHWAYRKLSRPAVPAVEDKSWGNRPVDAFVLKRLEDSGLQPSRPASKIDLIRRATFDLTGLPPTLEEVDSFLADSTPQAFETVVDRLLESPRYGEKWAQHWLDLVRYAETNGYERDSKKNLIWKYRDYVIRSLNQDKPANRFITEQLAGDELQDKTADSIIATGFYRLGVWDDEPADRELAHYDYLDDIVRTTSESFLGMTLGCARCHDHKIDPVSQKDYYSMLAFFSDITPHGRDGANHVAIATAGNQPLADSAAAYLQRGQQLQTATSELSAAFQQGMKEKHPAIKFNANGFTKRTDKVVLADSRAGGQTWAYTTQTPPDNWFEIAFDDSSWKTAPGGFGQQGTPGARVRTAWRGAGIWLRKDFRLEAVPDRLLLNIHHDEDASVYLNGKLIASFKGYLRDYKQVDITAKAAAVLQTGRNTLAIRCRNTGGGQYIDAGLTASGSARRLRRLAERYGPEVLGAQRYNRWKLLQRELAAHIDNKPAHRTGLAMAVAERGRRRTWILERGSPQAKGEQVEAGLPQILDPPPLMIQPPAAGGTTGKRLALARWVTSPQNPLTARVLANRLWQHLMGRGIVRTSSDFGFQGRPPTHPQLLDWLASELISGGWKMKRMHKLLMLSNVYQMASAANPQSLAKDPANNLFWRFNVRRLTAEEIRDSILATTDDLNLQMYGPAVFPPLPAEVLATASRPDSAWGSSDEQQAARRSIYVHVKRSLRVPMLADFDAPDPDSACAVRVTTTVPTQALSMLNSKFTNDQAARLAQRLQREKTGSLKQQVVYAIRLTTGRTPDANEIAADLQFISRIQADEKLPASRALQIYSLMLLNTSEFSYLQ